MSGIEVAYGVRSGGAAITNGFHQANYRYTITRSKKLFGGYDDISIEHLGAIFKCLKKWNCDISSFQPEVDSYLQEQNKFSVKYRPTLGISANLILGGLLFTALIGAKIPLVSAGIGLIAAALNPIAATILTTLAVVLFTYNAIRKTNNAIRHRTNLTDLSNTFAKASSTSKGKQTYVRLEEVLSTEDGQKNTKQKEGELSTEADVTTVKSPVFTPATTGSPQNNTPKDTPSSVLPPQGI